MFNSETVIDPDSEGIAAMFCIAEVSVNNDANLGGLKPPVEKASCYQF